METTANNTCLVELKPLKEDVEKMIHKLGGNYKNDDIFKAIFYVQCGYQPSEIPDIMEKAASQQLKTSNYQQIFNDAYNEQDKFTTSKFEPSSE
jgi:hypothetical protein